ncbi:hypothetical protein QAD02_020490 [Eretmocerus hayati]|uniref:Uncharacterized protein n=1 Tax=Eretmocerus hayati TaxID=131215 RepID=A0ACC2PMS6_9HYME|nr:hypothetical protein QAD02_020490 [Eretmocerus hayati]
MPSRYHILNNSPKKFHKLSITLNRRSFSIPSLRGQMSVFTTLYLHNFHMFYECNSKTLTCSVSKVLDHLEEELPKLSRHDFIAKNQARFMKKLKESLSFGDIFVQGDFSENLSFLVQDAVPGYYWSNNQATLHPWHDVNTIYAFQQDLIKLLKKKIPVMKKIIYRSDGAGGQYKNRFNFLNLAFHRRGFGVPAEGHFSATSHGKGPWNGVGGTLKRSVSRASLQRPVNHQIVPVEDLVSWASE